MLQKRGSKKRSNLRFLSNISYKKESRSSYYVSKQYRAAFVPLPCRRSSCFLVDCLPHPGPALDAPRGTGSTPSSSSSSTSSSSARSSRDADRGSRVAECADSVGLDETVGPASNRLPVGESAGALAGARCQTSVPDPRSCRSPHPRTYTRSRSLSRTLPLPAAAAAKQNLQRSNKKDWMSERRSMRVIELWR